MAARKKAQTEAQKETVTQERVVAELAKMAFANAADVIDVITRNLNQNAGQADMAAIASFKMKKVEGETEWIGDVKLYDKLKALELLGRHLGMFSGGTQMGGEMPVIVDDIAGDQNG